MYFFRAAINCLCGIGILSTPYAIKEGGWLSIFLLFMFGMITCYTGILLKRCLDSSSSIQTYPDIGQACFGISGRIWMAVSMKQLASSVCKNLNEWMRSSCGLIRWILKLQVILYIELHVSVILISCLHILNLFYFSSEKLKNGSCFV